MEEIEIAKDTLFKIGDIVRDRDGNYWQIDEVTDEGFKVTRLVFTFAPDEWVIIRN